MKKYSCEDKIHYLFFKNLANKTKIDIVTELRKSASSVGELSKKTGIEQSKLSHALQSLKTCSIVLVKQLGKKRIYSLNKETIVPILNIIDKHRCKYCKEKLKK
jgi:DNA-binding transcriptional ArsR family regulator